MMGKEPTKNCISFPLIDIGGKPFILLSHYTDSWIIRAVKVNPMKDCSDPNGHRLRQVSCKGSVKCHPKKLDFDDFLQN